VAPQVQPDGGRNIFLYLGIRLARDAATSTSQLLSTVMGNETSSVKIHSLLTADDIKRLRSTGFPDPARPPSHLDWGPWKVAWPKSYIENIERVVSQPSSQSGGQPGPKSAGGGATEISFNRYQEMAGNVVRGTTEERIKLLFYLIHKVFRSGTKELKASAGNGDAGMFGNAYESPIHASDLVMFVEDVVRAATVLTVGAPKATPAASEDGLTKSEAESSATLAKSLIKDLAFPNLPAKQCLHSQPEKDILLDFDAVERWTAIKCPLFDQLFRYALAASFSLQIADDTLPTRGDLKLSRGDTNTILNPADVFFLNSTLPGRDSKQCWRQLFNSSRDGQSFAKLEGSLRSAPAQTPTLLIVREQDTGYLFGGYAADPWGNPGPKFFGQNSGFLFHLHPRHFAYEATPYNSNYQYFQVNAKTFPNGLGMGGQIDFFGLWIDGEDYGKARCTPTCSSYASPQLTKEEFFHFDHLELWGVGDEPVPDPDDPEAAGAMSKDPEAMAVMEMMGKTFISKDVKAADENDEKQKKAEAAAAEEGKEGK